MLSNDKERILMRHQSFAKGTNDQSMIHKRLIDPELKQADEDFKRLWLRQEMDNNKETEP